MAAILTLALMLGGFGRGSDAVASAVISAVRIADALVPICHAMPADPSRPPAPGRGDPQHCCESCALCAAVLVPRPAVFAPRVPATYPGRERAVTRFAPVVLRDHSPKQSQGPPAA